jgi:hypothetical protein
MKLTVRNILEILSATALIISWIGGSAWISNLKAENTQIVDSKDTVIVRLTDICQGVE